MFIVSREKVYYHRDESGPNQKEADTSNLDRKTTEMNEAEDYKADWHTHQRCYQTFIAFNSTYFGLGRTARWSQLLTVSPSGSAPHELGSAERSASRLDHHVVSVATMSALFFRS